jgi:Acyl-CoA dehydrogenase, N-terminal domain
MKPNEPGENSIGESLNFMLPETHQSLRDLVRKFAETEIAPLVRQLDKDERFSEVLTREMGKLGLFGIVIPVRFIILATKRNARNTFRNCVPVKSSGHSG